MKFTDKDDRIKTAIIASSVMVWCIYKHTSAGYPVPYGVFAGSIFVLMIYSGIYSRKFPAPRKIKEDDLLYLVYRVGLIFGPAVLFSVLLAFWGLSLRASMPLKIE